jgi:mono/diheme cytochrome c family protein
MRSVLLWLWKPAVAAVLPMIAATSVMAQAAATSASGAASAAVATPAAVESGRQLFDTHCARCHGVLATGTANGPNLLPRVNAMSESSFASAVLQRYRFSVPASEGAGESAARDAMLRGLLSRRQDNAGMPAWEDDAAVASGVKSLYAYLSARAR